MYHVIKQLDVVCQGTISNLIGELFKNKIHVEVYEYPSIGLVFKLNDWSETIQDFINFLVPVGVPVLYDIKSTYRIYGSCLSEPSFFQNLRYRIRFWLLRRKKI